MEENHAFWQWENGQWHTVSGIPLSDRGFRHGMSAFETIAIRNGRFQFLPEHLEKLRHTCAQLGLREPPGADSFDIRHSSFITPPQATARIYVTAGDGDFRSPLNAGRIFLTVAATSSSPEVPGGVTASRLPSTLSISPAAHTPVWPSLKTGNYWPNIAAYRQATERHSDEIILVNADNHVISASLANVFAVIDGLLLTPRVSSGARAGVLRDWVIARTDTIISDFHPEQLREASEIFLTNSGYGIAPIESLEGKTLPSQNFGQQLRTAYLKMLETTVVL